MRIRTALCLGALTLVGGIASASAQTFIVEQPPVYGPAYGIVAPPVYAPPVVIAPVPRVYVVPAPAYVAPVPQPFYTPRVIVTAPAWSPGGIYDADW
jgi:hypothetical protein